VAALRVAEEERRAVRGAERRFKVVFELFIWRLDLLFLLHQGKRKRTLHKTKQCFNAKEKEKQFP